VTKNFNGQLSGNKGIHKYFETDNLEAHDEATIANAVMAKAMNLLNDKETLATYQKGVVEGSFTETDRSYAWLDDVISIDSKYGREGEGAERQIQLAIDRMADGAATLAVLLNRMWVEAGSPSQTGTQTVAKPDWVPPPYHPNLIAVSATHNADSIDHDLHELHGLEDHDDCYAE
jgi:hypothetical protein